MKLNNNKVTHDGKSYAVISMTYKGKQVPIVMDWEDFVIINKLDKYWKFHKGGYITCIDRKKNIEVPLHKLIMALKDKNKLEDLPILHINCLGIDNRRDNLMYDKTDKHICKNLRKKKRTIELPEESGINPDDIPTYVWYIKPDKTHGERFMVQLGGNIWQSTSSKSVPLIEKLEHAKDYLRNLKKESPELFENYSMNGEYNINGKKLIDSFFDIIHNGGFEYIEKNNYDNITDYYLQSK